MRGEDQYVTFFPWGDFTPSGGFVCYGPFTLEEARAHARTLSSDPDEGQVARLVQPDGGCGAPSPSGGLHCTLSRGHAGPHEDTPAHWVQ
jgi:hypothetical protein